MAFQMSRQLHHPYLDYPNNIYFKAQIKNAVTLNEGNTSFLLVHVGKKRSLPRICIERTDPARPKGWKTSQQGFCRRLRHIWVFGMMGMPRTIPSRAAPYFSFGVSGLLIFENWISARECELLTEVQGDVRAWQTVFIPSAVMWVIVICNAVCHWLVDSTAVVIAIERTIFQLSGSALCWQL